MAVDRSERCVLDVVRIIARSLVEDERVEVLDAVVRAGLGPLGFIRRNAEPHFDLAIAGEFVYAFHHRPDFVPISTLSTKLTVFSRRNDHLDRVRLDGIVLREEFVEIGLVFGRFDVSEVLDDRPEFFPAGFFERVDRRDDVFDPRFE
jgi:hypothetical protein